MNTFTILAIDLGKYNSVSCFYDRETKATTFRTIRTTPDEMRKLLARQPVSLVVIEACSGAGWVTDLCQSMNLDVAVANTAGEAWKWQHVKRKTDRDDALKLAAADGRVQLLATMPGMGPRTAEVIACHLVDVRRFRTAEELSAYAGMVPRQYQSGQTDRRGGCTKRGSKMLRSAVVEAAWCSLRYNAWARSHWLRLTEVNGVSRKKAVVALGRKLLVRCWGMLKSSEGWRDPTLVSSSNPTPRVG